MCRSCARDLQRLEAVGGILLDRLQPELPSKMTAPHALARLQAQKPAKSAALSLAEAPHDDLLRPLLLEPFPSADWIPWQDIAPGIACYRMRAPADAGDIRLIRLAPGKTLPLLGASAELVLVLQGALAAQEERFLRGDIIDAAEDGESELTAIGQRSCICLVGAAPSRKDVGAVDGVLASLRSRIRQAPPRWKTIRDHAVALAASLAMIIGVGLGWLAHGNLDPGIEFVSAEGHWLMARGMLTNALETLPSGKKQRPSGHGQSLRLSIRMTFQDRAGAWCRQYQITSASSASYSGIACRKDGKWEVRFQALMPSQPSHRQGSYVPADAGANAAMDAIIADWMAGSPLVGEEEAAVIRTGWKPSGAATGKPSP
jgi:anti-sigma factor ChrR (cupin superfamily)